VHSNRSDSSVASRVRSSPRWRRRPGQRPSAVHSSLLPWLAPDRHGERRSTPGELPAGSVTESYRDPIREAGRESGTSPCLGPCPCLPTLSCINTRQGGSSLHFPMPRKPPISGADDTTARIPPFPYDRMVDHVSSLTANGWWREAAFRRRAPVVRERSRGSRDGTSTGQGAAFPLTSSPLSTCTPGPGIRRLAADRG
jgi:hypothetical protein